MAADKPEISRLIYQRIDVIVLHLKRYTDLLWKCLKQTKATAHVKFLTSEIQTGSRNPPKPEVVITRRREDISTWSQRLRHSFLARPIPLHLRWHRQTTWNTIRYKPEVETVPQTGSTNNIATETDIDAILVAIPMFWGRVFTGVYVNFARNFLPSEIPRWRTYTESSYSFATENDTKVISTAAEMFQATPDQRPTASTLSD